MKEVLIAGKKICKAFGKGNKGGQILKDTSVYIYQGDFTIIMGPSGAGKSTLLYVLSGMDRADGGSVEYQGQDLGRMPEKAMADLRAREFGFVFQQAHLIENLTLFENVLVAGLVGRKGTSEQVRERAKELLDRMGVGDAAGRLPGAVSGGEMQRAAIARAVVGSPDLLFCDEPTGALNRGSTEEVLDLLCGLNGQGQSILMVTHDMRAAVRGNRILYLEDGKILDELNLPSYNRNEEKEREEHLSRWLSGLRW